MRVQPQGGRELAARLVEMSKQKEYVAERPVADVVVWPQLHRFARIRERRFRVEFRQVPEHLQVGAYLICDCELRIELDDLVGELPCAAERSEPVPYPTSHPLVQIRVGQEARCPGVFWVEIDRPLKELLSLIHVRGSEALKGRKGLDRVLPGFQIARPPRSDAGCHRSA